VHVVVVGAGVFGVWTAHHLRESGAEVTLVEAQSPGHSRSSSGDETRIVRYGYGPDRIYSEMAHASLAQWRALDARSGMGLWHPCGILWLAAGSDPYTDATRRTLQACGYRHDVLDRDALQRRFPELHVADSDGRESARMPDAGCIDVAVLEAESGVILARRAVRALADDLASRGVRLIHALVRPPGDRLDAIETSGGPRIAGDRFVFTCGAWLPEMFPDLLGGRIRPTRQVVVYFGTPPGDGRFQSPRWPAWIDFPSGIYGTPDIDGRGVKVGIDEHGPPIDPDTAERIVDGDSIARARAWLARRVPALATAPVIESRVCQYENTSTGDFLIDRHPVHANVWIAGGGSGHGFKHGPAVGERVARMVMTGERAEPRFSLEHKTRDARRAIY
jgi:glycine/D-amino acid oxidase-like deaminating enzyme